MKKLNLIMQEIIRLTAEMETHFPELYQHLEETPLPLGQKPDGDISTAELENYLNTLREQLITHLETHQKK